MQSRILRHYCGLPPQRQFKYVSRDWGGTIPSVRRDLTNLGLSNYIGIPPNIRDTEANISTQYSLVKIIIEILKELEPACSLEEAAGQVRDVTTFVNCQALNESERLSQELLDRNRNNFEVGGFTIGFQAPKISNLPTNILGLSYKKHLVLLGSNGSIQILKLPSFLEMIEIIKADEIAKKEILDTQPLVKEAYESYGGLEEFQINDIQELYDLLHLQHDQENNFRISSDGDTDPNILLRRISFDLPKHIKAKRIQVLLEKHGVDGLTLWQSEKDKFYQHRRLNSKKVKN